MWTQLKLNIQPEVPVLSISVRIVDSVRDVGVVIRQWNNEWLITLQSSRSVEHEPSSPLSASPTWYFLRVRYQLITRRHLSRSSSDRLTVWCLLDYCNALVCDISAGLIRRLQSVQNVTFLALDTEITSHAVLRQLHWLWETDSVQISRAGIHVSALLHTSYLAVDAKVSRH